jgi:hypothetical protein
MLASGARGDRDAVAVEEAIVGGGEAGWQAETAIKISTVNPGIARRDGSQDFIGP